MDGGYIQVSNTDMPAGYTYFAQFVIHDLTGGPTGRLDLRSLYGAGPEGSTNLYEADRYGTLKRGRYLGTGTLHDVPRTVDGVAIMGDARNDRTIMLGQVHSAFVELHNMTLASLDGRDRVTAFAEARRRVVRHYHRLVADDLLPRFVDRPTIRQAFDTRGIRPREIVPLEFSQAVGQVGHAMVKPRYRINDVVQAPVFRRDGAWAPYCDLRGQPLDERAAIDWCHFFPLGEPVVMQRAGKFNTRICRPLFEVPVTGPLGVRLVSLPYVALSAAARCGLPSGETVARRLGREPMARETVWQRLPYASAESPLWFYVLREAETQQGGRRLGDVGGLIFARVVLDALRQSGVADQALLPQSALADGTSPSVGGTLSLVASGVSPIN